MDNSNKRLDYLLEGFAERTLSEAEFAELSERIEQDEIALEQYLDKVLIDSGLTEWANYKWPSDHHKRQYRPAAQASEFEPDPKHTRSRVGLVFPSANRLNKTILALAALVLLSLSVGGAWWFSGLNAGNDRPSIAGGGGDSVQPQDDIATPFPESYVAQVIGLSPDAEFNNVEPSEFLLRLKQDEELNITKGDATIEFQSGARLVLFGPASIQILGSDRVRVVSGHVTGFAEDGNFTVETDSAKIVDLGTKFGVEVDPSGGTKVSVFDGSVDVSAVSNEAQKTPSRILAGKAVQVARNGNLSPVAPSDIRSIADPSPDDENGDGFLSLVDIIAGGDGTGRRIAGAIDPNTGNGDMVVPETDVKTGNLLGTRIGNGKFNKNIESPFIDGAFVAGENGNSIVVNSNGDRLEIEKNDGITWGPIWARRKFGLGSHSVPATDFWGTETLRYVGEVLQESGWGIVGIHPNVGISFDLQQLRAVHGDDLAEFSGSLINLDNSKLRNPEWAKTHHSTAHFRVVIDGELRFERKSLARSDGRVPFQVPLKNRDRFMTLISSDAGDSNWFDHLVLVDPVISKD